MGKAPPAPPKIKRIFSLMETLPYFTFATLVGITRDKTYLRVLLSRYAKQEKTLRLKKGHYVTRTYLDHMQKKSLFPPYLEFVANQLLPPSYLSLDYVLHEHALLTEMPTTFTSITSKKTSAFTNPLGSFYYHHIKAPLYTGFHTVRTGPFMLYKASKAKALFDFLYLRKNLLPTKKAITALRINTNLIDPKDAKELRRYAKLSGLNKMQAIVEHFLH